MGLLLIRGRVAVCGGIGHYNEDDRVATASSRPVWSTHSNGWKVRTVVVGILGHMLRRSFLVMALQLAQTALDVVPRETKSWCFDSRQLLFASRVLQVPHACIC